MTTSGFSCMECGKVFRTLKAAEKAAFGSRGCPNCGGTDIDLDGPDGEIDIPSQSVTFSSRIGDDLDLEYTP